METLLQGLGDRLIEDAGREWRRDYNRDYMQRYRANHPEYSKYMREYRANHPEYVRHQNEIQKKRARTHVSTTRNGKFVHLYAPRKRVKPSCCELCSRNNSILQYYHWDDSNPSKGLWVCYRCHTAIEVMDKNPGITEKYYTLREEVEREFATEKLVEAGCNEIQE